MQSRSDMKAFPASSKYNDEYNGMDLRDYFAAKALQMIAETYKESWIEDGDFQGYSETEVICIAEGAYEMADAMIEARKK